MSPDLVGDDGADRISGLPDELLHAVLVRLRCTAAAARTSALSRRWRRVWLHLPELYFCDRSEPPEPRVRSQDRVDAALAAHSAATTSLSRLHIEMPCSSSHVAPERVCSWLQFASRRLRAAGELRLSLPCGDGDDIEKVVPEERPVAVPVCAGATSIAFHHVMSHTLRFPPPAAGAFAALAVLGITQARVDGPELEGMLSSACPRLKKLVLVGTFLRDEARGLYIRSESLEELHVMNFLSLSKLHVAAPELQVLSLCLSWDVYVVAPKLSVLKWIGGSYNPARHIIGEAGQRLRLLKIETTESHAALMKRFNTVNELVLSVEIPLKIPQGTQDYERYVCRIKKFSMCEIVTVHFGVESRAFRPTMLHILKKCPGIRKLVVYFRIPTRYSPLSDCSNSSPKRCKIEAIAFSAIEELRAICRPNLIVEFNMLSNNKRWVRINV